MTTKEKLAEIKRLKLEVEKDLPQLIENYKAKVDELKEAMEKKLKPQLDEIRLIDPEWTLEPVKDKKKQNEGKKKSGPPKRLDHSISAILRANGKLNENEIIKQLKERFANPDQIRATLTAMANPKRGKGALDIVADGIYDIRPAKK